MAGDIVNYHIIYNVLQNAASEGKFLHTFNNQIVGAWQKTI